MQLDERLNMGKQDIDKVHVIRGVIERRYTQVEAARILRLGDRQIRRLCIRVRAYGARGVLHGLRGQPSNHQCDAELLGKARSAVHDPLWKGFGPTFAQQKLEGWYDVVLSDHVALKTVLSTSSDNPSAVKRLLSEARLARP